MKEKLRKNKGITLIALVITIVVLIILAGVAINMTLGENGVFNKAKKARDDYASVAANEEGAINSIDIDSLTGGKTTSAKPTEITASSFGEYIDYPIDLNEDGDTTNDWMIFYQSSNTSGILNTYIISADYLKNADSRLQLSNIGATEADSSTYPYSMYWNSAPTSLQTTSQNSLFMATKYTLNSSNANSKVISTLLNTTNWTGYINTDYADYAIGSPTLEMWVASWNDKYKSEVELFTNTDTDNTGYYVGNTEGTTDYRINVSSVTDAYKTNSLYFPRVAEDSNCYGYRLASPSAYGTKDLMAVYCAGTIGSDYDYYYNDGCCARPLVHLTSNISLERNANGIWEKK